MLGDLDFDSFGVSLAEDTRKRDLSIQWLKGKMCTAERKRCFRMCEHEAASTGTTGDYYHAVFLRERSMTYRLQYMLGGSHRRLAY